MKTMYFSVITPEDGLLRQAVHELTQAPDHGRPAKPYAEHQWLWRFFPSDEDQRRDFVFRRHDLDGVPRFYVVSHRPPGQSSPAWLVRTRAYAPNLVKGQRLSFDLFANPVVSRKDDAGKSRRHDVVMQAKKRLMAARGLDTWANWTPQDGRPELYDLVQDECLQWLASRASTHGFIVSAAMVDTYQQNIAGAREIRFSTVNFSGELVVTDPERFQNVLFNGLGHAKAFGCGLLLVRIVDQTDK
jgi:CRISPR system Cascade subunit CasE